MNRKLVLFILINLGISSTTALSFHISSVMGTIWIEGHITSDTTWTPVDTYHVINNTYVDPGVTLTIEPGVHVQFADGFSLIVEGSLNATGTEAVPIIFTSSRSSPSPGAWDTIKFKGNSSELFLLKQAKVEYAVHGVTVQSLEMAVIEKNEITDCSESGIMLMSTSGDCNVVIMENTIKQNKNGISTDSAETQSGIIITNNTISSNHENGIHLYTMFSAGGGSIIRNITVCSNTVSSNGENGIHLESHGGYGSRPGIRYIILSANKISSNIRSGIYLSTHAGSISGGGINDVTICSNTVSSNGENGIHLYAIGTSLSDTVISNVTVCFNTVSSNNKNGILLNSSGLYSGEIANVTVCSNTVSSNGENGIHLYGHSDYEPGNVRNCNVSGNSITNNNDGLRLYSSSYSIISRNIMKTNKYYGLALYWSSNNSIYHNNFIDNTQPVYLSLFGYHMNYWDDGYPSGGNYWSDYEERYPNTTEIGSSGIWDTPYIINFQTNEDAYPLMSPTTPIRRVFTTHSFGVEIVSNSSISEFKFNSSSRELSFNMTGPVGTAGFCDIAIPDDLLWGEFSIYIDGSLLLKDVDYTQTYNGTLHAFHITYIHSTHLIGIISTEVIPEFPLLLTLPLLMTATLLVATAYRRKRLSKQLSRA